MQVAEQVPRSCMIRGRELSRLGDAIVNETTWILNQTLPIPSSNLRGPRKILSPRFVCNRIDHVLLVHDSYLSLYITVPLLHLENPAFDLVNFYSTHARRAFQLARSPCDFDFDEADAVVTAMAVTVPANTIPALQRNAGSTRDFRRLIPEPIVVVVQVNDQPARALLDSGSLADFMSAKLAHQLGIKSFELEKPLPVHLAVQGSRAKVNLGCKAELSYQNISGSRYFDIVNLLNYDLILGTPFLFQHRISLGFNPITVSVGSPQPLRIEGKHVRVLESRAADVLDNHLDEARLLLREYAADICKDASDSPLPPLRAINHTIPLKDPHKTYTWRPSRCPDAHRASWTEKRDAYLKS
ncbi:hypothetical protein K474DRAFT_1611805, partial [Panus rudis PR-1116 ss-1]